MKIYLREDNVTPIPFLTHQGPFLIFHRELRCRDKNIEHAVIPEGIEAIDCEGFRNCTKLKTIELPDTLKIIGQGAFMACEELEHITIPENVEWVNGDVFAGCSSLHSIDIQSNNITFSVDAFGDFSNDVAITYKGFELSSLDIECAVNDYNVEAQETLYGDYVSLDDVVEKTAMQRLRDAQDIERGIRPDSCIADENDWGF